MGKEIYFSSRSAFQASDWRAWRCPERKLCADTVAPSESRGCKKPACKCGWQGGFLSTQPWCGVEHLGDTETRMTSKSTNTPSHTNSEKIRPYSGEQSFQTQHLAQICQQPVPRVTDSGREGSVLSHRAIRKCYKSPQRHLFMHQWSPPFMQQSGTGSGPPHGRDHSGRRWVKTAGHDAELTFYSKASWIVHFTGHLTCISWLPKTPQHDCVFRSGISVGSQFGAWYRCFSFSNRTQSLVLETVFTGAAESINLISAHCCYFSEH